MTSSAQAEGILNVKDFGVAGDGKSDDTTAIQSAIDAAAKSGDKLYIPAGQYLVSGSIKVKPGVAIEGAANSPRFSNPLTGTVILATGGRDKEDAPPLFELVDSTSVSGLTIYYPEQKAVDIRPYPWTFHLIGTDNTLENITLINSYNAIKVGGEKWNVRHRIRSVYGCALRRGILVDGCSDVGRIDNVHFHGHWWWAYEVGGAPDNPDGTLGPVNRFLMDNFEAFTFGRTDWEYVTNTFIFIAKTGYHFIKTDKGASSAQLVGIGADAVHSSVIVDGIVSWWTLIITNGQFASDGKDTTAVGVLVNGNEAPSANGPVRLVNCSILGPQAVVSHSPAMVSMTGCNFNAWGGNTGKPMVEADNGKLQVQGCTFDANNGGALKPMPSIALRKGVKHAIISENMGTSGVQIINEIGTKAVLRDNEPFVPVK
ncbi:MAG: glycosyl hydrolase family 28-related protein [Armatimonadota bacterium]